jgi:nickel-dependent lactate racemase
MLGKVLCVNTVLDENRNLSYANFGEIIGSHMKAVEFAEKYVSVPTKEKFDVVLTSGAGFPLDQTYYQTVKGMVVPMQILKDGGKLVIASQCTEGMGSEEYKNAQRQLVALGAKNFLKNIAQKSFADIDEWQTQMQTKTMGIGSIHLYESGLNDEEKSLTGVDIIDDIELFLAGCMKQKSDGTYPTLAVIPEGPYVVPLYKD